MAPLVSERTINLFMRDFRTSSIKQESNKYLIKKLSLVINNQYQRGTK